MNKLIGSILLFIAVLNGVPAYGGSSKTVFVLFDVSGSTQGNRKEYLEGFRRILDIRSPAEAGESRLGLQDAIVADVITDNSLSTSRMPIEKEFNYSFWRGQNVTYNAYQSISEKEKLAKEAEALLFQKGTRGTDILSSLRLAERVFGRYKRERSVLVIFSDMIEQSAGYDFEKENLTEKRISEIIRQEKAKGLPNLVGVVVYAAGANAKTSARFLRIRAFWVRYFSACGAVLDKASYGRAFMGISG